MTLTQWNFEQLELGEGARWINGRLVVVDLLAGRVLETPGDVPAPFQEIARLPVPVGAVAPVRGSDRLMAASGTGACLLGEPQRESFAGVGMRVNDAVAERINLAPLQAGVLPVEATLARRIEQTLRELVTQLRQDGELPEGTSNDLLVRDAQRDPSLCRFEDQAIGASRGPVVA